MNETYRKFGASYAWGNTLPLLRSADVRLINLECVIAATGKPWTRTHKTFHFRAEPIAMDSLLVARIDCVSLANNHVLDYGEDALEEMLQRLDSKGIAHAGAGRNLAEATRPAVLTVGSTRIAVTAFTDNQPEWAASPAAPGVNFISVEAGDANLQRFEESIGSVRTSADLIVCSAHWGPNMRLRPPPEFRRLAHRLIDGGVDLFYGHSAHVFQGIEVYREKPILYDTGDYVDDYAVDRELRNDRSFLFLLELSREGIRSIDLFPTLISRQQVNLATGSEFSVTCRTMQELSAEMGTELAERPEGLHLRLVS
jgi:poly-gamma-glutamate synthesis protein (capsule biosynthesis protein)